MKSVVRNYAVKKMFHYLKGALILCLLAVHAAAQDGIPVNTSDGVQLKFGRTDQQSQC